MAPNTVTGPANPGCSLRGAYYGLKSGLTPTVVDIASVVLAFIVIIVCQHLVSLYRLLTICYYLAVGLRPLGRWWVTDKRSFGRRRL